jgi:hypothetical protein
MAFRWPLPRYQPVALADGDVLALGEPQCRHPQLPGGARRLRRGAGARQPVDRHARARRPAGRGHGRRAARACAWQRGALVGAPEAPPADLPTVHEEVVLDIVLGPRTDWFTPDAVALLCSQSWAVTPQSNRVGIRLAGEVPLARANHAELPSEGTAWARSRCRPAASPCCSWPTTR